MKLKLSVSSQNKLQHRSNICLNCERTLKITHKYCPYCGQINSTKKLSLGNYFNEFIVSLINYDSRIYYTLKDILFKPGKITLRYVNGKRHTYANPFRFYLSISIIYFLLSGFLDFVLPKKSSTELEGFQEVFSEFTAEDSKIPLDSIKYYRENYKEINKTDSIKTPFSYLPEEKINQNTFYSRTKNKLALFKDFATSTDIKNAPQALDSLAYDKSRINLWLYDRSTTYNRILEEPLLFASYLSKKIPLFLFFFTPIFALFFMLIYFKRESYKTAKSTLLNTDSKTLRKIFTTPYIGYIILSILGHIRKIFVIHRKRTYIEHVIFIFHVFTFLFLVLLLALIPDSFIGNAVVATILFMIVAPIYFYIALKNFYTEGHIKTLLKFLFLNIVFLVLTSFTGILFLIITAATY